MNTEKKTSVETVGVKNEMALTAPTAQGKNNFSPIFVEAEKMFERLADLTQTTGHKAYEFFQKRCGECFQERALEIIVSDARRSLTKRRGGRKSEYDALQRFLN